MTGSRIRLKTYRLSRITIPILSVLFIASLLILSETAFSAALDGLKLWLWVVFPSLFPFFVGSEILNSTGFARAIGVLLESAMRPLFNVPGCGAFAFAMGISSGYPLGAKITADMREKGMLTKTEAERLLCFTNNSGPLFIAGAVAVGMYGNPRLGALFLTCHYLACITVGIIFRFYKRDRRAGGTGGQVPCPSSGGLGQGTCPLVPPVIRKAIREFFRYSGENRTFGTVFGDAVKNSVTLLLGIGGFIIIFSVIINLLLHFGIIRLITGMVSPILTAAGVSRQIIPPVISGLFEITTGVNLASKAVSVPLVQQLSATSFIIGWAGLSVHSQVISIIAKTDIGFRPYLLAKFLQGIFAAVYTCLFLKAGSFFLFDAYTVFAPSTPGMNLLNPVTYMAFSVHLFILTHAILLALSIAGLIYSALRPHRKT